MKMLNSIAEKFRGTPAINVIEDAIAEMRAGLGDAELAATALQGELDAVILESPSRVTEIRAKLADNGAERETLRLMISAAEKRKAEALAEDARLTVENKMRETRATWEGIKVSYIELHKSLKSAADSIQAIRDGERTLREANAFASASGRTDLAIMDPYNMLVHLVGNHGHNNPALSELKDYLAPSAHPDGPILARMKEVKL